MFKYQIIIDQYNLDTLKLPNVTRRRMNLIEETLQLFHDACELQSKKILLSDLNSMDKVISSELNSFIKNNSSSLVPFQNPHKVYKIIILQMSDWYCNN